MSGNLIEAASAGCVCFNIRKVSRVVTQFYDQRLKPSGLRATQFSLLVAVRLDGGATLSQLARRLAMDHSTLTRNLAPLIRTGLLESLPGLDRRTRQLKITGRGKKTMEAAAMLWKGAQTAMQEGLGPKGLAELHGLLSRTLGIAQKSAGAQ